MAFSIPNIRALGPGQPCPILKKESTLFRFGNGQEEVSDKVAVLPVGIHGRSGTIEAAVIKGDAPLLLSRNTMRSLKAVMDFAEETLSIQGGLPQSLVTNSAGQFVIDVMNFAGKSGDATVAPPPMAEFTECKRVSQKENRCLMANSEAWGENLKGDTKCIVAELFSPPRFSEQAEKVGKTGLAFDLLQGWDLTIPKVQSKVDAMLAHARPDLLKATFIRQRQKCRTCVLR